ncbi:MAG: hypothetical protein DRP84_01225 [Spirochaetes bacterium]|nr:MAG: hypothetical protein DRP84_01225 [Spirochaetota bacterium]
MLQSNKKRRIIFYKLIYILIMFVFLWGISDVLYGDDSPINTNTTILDLQIDNYKLIDSRSYSFNFENYSDFNSDGGYKETSFRRFEIIFFISLPVSFLLTLGGTLLYKQASGNRGNFIDIEYSYLTLSSVGISASVAIRDYLLTRQRIEK